MPRMYAPPPSTLGSGGVVSPAQKRMKRRICVLYCAGRVSVSTIMDSDNTNITGQAQYLDIVQRYIQCKLTVSPPSL